MLSGWKEGEESQATQGRNVAELQKMTSSQKQKRCQVPAALALCLLSLLSGEYCVRLSLQTELCGSSVQEVKTWPPPSLGVSIHHDC